MLDKLSPVQRDEIDKHHKIKISFRQSLALFWENLFSDICCGIFLCECCVQNPKRSKLAKLYDVCQDKIDAELDVVKIIRNLKNLRIIAKNNIAKDPIMKIQIEHNEKNFVNLDSDGADMDALMLGIRRSITQKSNQKSKSNITQRSNSKSKKPIVENKYGINDDFDDIKHTYEAAMSHRSVASKINMQERNASDVESLKYRD